MRLAREGGFAVGASLSMLAADACDGPLPVGEAISRCEELLREANVDRSAEVGVRLALAHLIAMRRDFAAARQELAVAHELSYEFGFLGALPSDHALFATEVAVLAGDDEAAVETLRSALDELERHGDPAWTATLRARLAEVMAENGSSEKALELSALAAEFAARDDIRAQSGWRRARAKALDELSEADRLAREAISLLSGTDEVNEQARAHAVFAEVLRRADRREEAAAAASAAAKLLVEKGNAALRTRLEV